MSTAKTLIRVGGDHQCCVAPKAEAPSRRRSSSHGASAVRISRFATPEVEIRCEKSSTAIRSAIGAYRDTFLTSNGSTASNRAIVRTILFPAFKSALEKFDTDWKLREHDGAQTKWEYLDFRVDTCYTKSAIEIMAEFLSAKYFTPERVGNFGTLLGLRNVEVGSADIDAICSTFKFIYRKEWGALQKKLKRSKRYRFDREIYSFGKFCALCDDLTELHGKLRVRSHIDIHLEIDDLRMRSSTYCKDHAPKGARHEDAAARAKGAYEHFVMMILQETRHSDEFRMRFIAPDSSAYEGPTEATSFRLPRMTGTAASSPSEFAYIANVRHIARILASQSASGNTAVMIDCLVQKGMPKADILRSLGISRSLFTRRCDLAIARLRYQGRTSAEICKALDISPQSLSQKKMATGCFDFSEQRNPFLIWWPYNDLKIRDLACLNSRAETAWRHTASEYAGKSREGRTIFQHSLKPNPLACPNVLVKLF